MHLRRIEIDRFRGINHLRWDPGARVMCLVGPGDSTKSTILDAIEFLLSPRWNIPFDDSDFLGAETSQPFSITGVVGQLPSELLKIDRFGLRLRGWSRTGELLPEPEEGEGVLVVRLRVENDLEPQWFVVDGKDQEHRLSAKDRERFGAVAVGRFSDRHLSWARGAVLSRLTGDLEEVPRIISAASRAARETFKDVECSSLRATAGRVEKLARGVGVRPTSGYRPDLDPISLSLNAGGISLHDGEIPVRRLGQGTRRLLAIAMQSDAARCGGITLVDEVEDGLEPHRIRQLLRFLRRDARKSVQEEGHGLDSSQLIMTSHSPIVIGELESNELGIVRRSADGAVEIRTLPSDLRVVLRGVPEAFLSARVIVCEGKTEIGLLQALDQAWEADTGASFAYRGAALVHGEGSSAPRRAQALAQLGFSTFLLRDSDQPCTPSEEDLRSVGVTVFQWAGGVAIEERAFADLPWPGVVEAVQIVFEERSPEGVRSAVASRLKIKDTELGLDPDAWRTVVAEAELRRVLGDLAKKSKPAWFKRVDLGARLGQVIAAHLEAIPRSGLARTIAALRSEVHKDA